MRNLRKLLERLATDAACWRILAHEFRILFLELGQLAVQLIVFAVANSGRRFFVVTAIVLSDVAPQRLDTRARSPFGHRLIIRTPVHETIASAVIPSDSRGIPVRYCKARFQRSRTPPGAQVW